MAIRTVVTAGFGNGTFDGTIALVVVRGYAAAVVAAVGSWEMIPPWKKRWRIATGSI